MDGFCLSEPVRGVEFLGEKFRSLKETEIKKHSEYRTQRLVLEYYRAWATGDHTAFDRWLSPELEYGFRIECRSQARRLGAGERR